MGSSRIWDRFLTEQDRALAKLQRTASIGFGRYPALILVDLYKSVFGDKPEAMLQSVKKWPLSCGLAAWNALPKILELLRTARELKIPIVHTTNIQEEKSGIKGWAKLSPAEKRMNKPETLGGNKRSRQRFQIIDQLRPISGEIVVSKSSPSAFWGTALIRHFTRLGIDTIVIAGESTSGCIRATVVDGCTIGYNMIVVEDCVFDRTEASHAISLFDMNAKYADVISISDAIRSLKECNTLSLMNSRKLPV